MQGLIVENISNMYKVKAEDKIYESTARGKFKKEDITPVVGDMVELEIIDETNRKAVPATAPVAKKCQNLHPAIIIIVAQIPIITIDALKWGSNKSNPIIGAKRHMFLINPFVYNPNSSLFLTKIPA